ncbi:M4 family metallopeptidase [uncultured Paludibaculum sp.]|uniref:M4 family metallopeptidase n=1 Tax=uncultured Paludibaculum sp. TaxID=1765020 RepID=UPI002AAA83CC|nr:M4 family metallopeptidase [uncultured Paludibaculum sp.]
MRLTTSLFILSAFTGGLLFAERRVLSEDELARLEQQQAARIDTSKAYVETQHYRLGLDANSALRPIGNPVLDEFGTLHVRFLQLFHGIPVRTGQVVTHLTVDGQMLQPTNRLHRRVDVDTNPAINAQQALETIRLDLAAGNRALANMPASAIAGTPELYIDPVVETVALPTPAGGPAPNADDETRRVSHYRLIYRVLAMPAEEADDAFNFHATYYFVDAAAGRIVRKTSAEVNDDVREPAVGNGFPIYRRKVQLNTTKVNGEYQLYDITRGNWPGNTTRSNNNTDSHKYKKTSPITDGSNSWGDNQRYSSNMPLNGETAQSPAVDIFWAVTRTYDVLANVFKFKGLDGNNTPISTRAHYDVNYTDAHYNYGAQAAFFGDGIVDPDPDKNVFPNIPLPTVAHELGHGVWGHQMSTDYDRPSEASGLNEGHGDILGAITNFYTNVTLGKGKSLTYANDNNYFHYRMYTPSSYPPDPSAAPFYNQTGRRYWQPGMGTFEEHVQGCAYGHMFVMLVEGASPDSDASTYSTYFPKGMAGIGLAKAARIWFLASTVFPPYNDPTFATMRDAWVDAAEYAYGADSPEVNAVINAWAAINVGKAVKDIAQPQVSVSSLQLDEKEGSLLITASASDDTFPMVEFGLGNSVRATRRMPPYQAVIDISSLKPGTYTAFARAVDFMGKSTIKSAQFTITGTNQAISNGSFEDGTDGWGLSAGEMLGTNAPTAYLGQNYLRFRDDGQAANHKFKLPKEALNATLSIRYRVVGVEYLPGENLFVDLYDSSINKTTSLADVSSEEVTISDPLHHYKRLEFNVTQFKDKDMLLRFKASLSKSNTTRFVVDAVSLTYALPQAVVLKAELDEPGHVVRMRATTTGISADSIKSVQYRINGQTVGLDGSTLDGAVFNTGAVPAGTYNVQAFLVRFDDSALGSNIVPITFTGKKNQVTNGGFENGQSGWSLPGLNSSIGMNDGENQMNYAQTGVRYARFVTSGAAGTSKIRQLIAIPQNPQSVTVSFYLRMRVSAKDPGDVFKAALVSIDNQVLLPITSVTGATTLPPQDAVAGYTRMVYTLTPAQLAALRGKTVYMQFSVDQNASTVTSFYVDDVSVYAPVLGLGN